MFQREDIISDNFLAELILIIAATDTLIIKHCFSIETFNAVVKRFDDYFDEIFHIEIAALWRNEFNEYVNLNLEDDEQGEFLDYATGHFMLQILGDRINNYEINWFTIQTCQTAISSKLGVWKRVLEENKLISE